MVRLTLALTSFALSALVTGCGASADAALADDAVAANVVADVDGKLLVANPRNFPLETEFGTLAIEEATSPDGRACNIDIASLTSLVTDELRARKTGGTRGGTTLTTARVTHPVYVQLEHWYGEPTGGTWGHQCSGPCGAGSFDCCLAKVSGAGPDVIW